MHNKKLIKALILGGTIFTGFTLNSTDAKAAEVDEVAIHANVADNNDADANEADTNDNQEESNPVIADCNRYLEELKGDEDLFEENVDYSEGKLEEIREYLNNDWMTVDKANEFKDDSFGIGLLSDKFSGFVKEDQGKITGHKNAAEEEFNKQAANSGLEEFANECRDAEDTQQKVDIINEAIDVSNANCKSFLDTHAEELEAYNAVIDEVNKAEAVVAEAEEIFNRADHEYAWAVSDPEVDLNQVSAIVAATEDGPLPYSSFKAEKERIIASGGEGYEALYNRAATVWGREVLQAVNIYDIFNEIVETRNNAEKELANRKAQLEALTADKEGYRVIAPEKKKNKAFVDAAKSYRDIIVINAEAQVSVARSQVAYKKMTTAKEEIDKLLDEYLATQTGVSSNDITKMMQSIVEIEKTIDVLEQHYNQAKSLVDSNALTDEAAVNSIDNISAEISSVQTTADSLQKKYNEVVVKTANAKAGFEKAAENNGMTHYAIKCQETTNPIEKIDVIDKAIEAANETHATFVSEHADELTYETVIQIEGKIEYIKNQISNAEGRINSSRVMHEIDPVLFSDSEQLIAELEASIAEYVQELDVAKAEYEALKNTAYYDLVVEEHANYESFIKAANAYKNAVAIMAQTDALYERGQNDLVKVVSYSTQLAELIKEYDSKNIGDVSEDEKLIDLEIKDAERDLYRVETAFKKADDEFNLFAAESAFARAEYDRLNKAKVEDPLNEKIAQYEAELDRMNVIIDKYNEELAKGDFESEEYIKAYNEYVAIDLDYLDIMSVQVSMWYDQLASSYDCVIHREGYDQAVEDYNRLKKERDAAAQTLAEAQKKLDNLNAKKAALGNTNNSGAETPTENSQEQAEQTALSEDVYTVFNNVKAIVMENPEIAQKFYEVVKNVSKNENAVQAITYAYNYVKSNVKISTINHYAKQLAGIEITPELVNKYLDMVINWINK